MAKNTITLFMWGYQPHYCVTLELHAKRVFETLGIAVEPKALLVGVRRPGMSDAHPVCVEPEDGEWPLALFEGLPTAVDRIVRDHPLQNTFYGDEPSMRDKPENMRRDSVRRALVEALHPFDARERVRSFCGTAAPVGNFHVVPVVQVPEAVFESFPPLREPIGDDRFAPHPSFIHAALGHLLDEAIDELQRPDPGRHVLGKMRTAEEIVRQAAATFMKTPGLAIGDRNFYFDLFEQFNVISSLLYEGTKGAGRLLLANPENPALEYALRLAEPVPFRAPRWARKILQMASVDVALIADCEKIHGLGTLRVGHEAAKQDIFTIDFLDHYHWQLRCGDQVLLRSRYGVPALPQEVFPTDRLVDTFRRLFPDAGDEDVDAFVAIFETAVAQRHGSMLVVAEDAATEAQRLQGQGTRVQPTRLTPDLYGRVSGIDGTIIVDPHCVCHAIGVILDGPARPECTPSRGSRYNSGIRYVGASRVPRLAVVVSDDRTVDAIPILRPRIRRNEVESAIVELEGSTRDNYHRSINWLDRHRFYLGKAECDRVNAALGRIRSEPMDVGEMMIQWNEFTPNPGLDDSYFFPEASAGGSSK
jgi:hypothetical protein